MDISIRALYSGSKGRYICGVCLDPPIHHASSQRDMEDHIKCVHYRTALAWILRNETESPEKLPVQEGDDQDAEDKPLHDDDASDAHADRPPPEDLSLCPLSRNKLMEWINGIWAALSATHLRMLLTKIKSISEMPKQHFITCFFPCTVDGSVCIAVEQYTKTFSYPTKGHCQSAIRHVIYNAIQLELEGIVHGNLKSANMVDVHYVPKYCSRPVEFQSYSNFRANIDIQHHQICDCVDLIVGDRTRDEDYKVFRTRLLGSKTIVDLHSILYSPYLTPERQQPVYYCSCRLLLHYTKIQRFNFNTIVENFRKDWSNIAASSSQNQISWLERLKNSNHSNLIQMLDTRFSVDGSKREYDDSAFSNHEFIYNSKRHIKDNPAKISTLEDMHKIMEALFHEYPSEIWEYMHIHGLNAYFGPEEYAYGMLNLVNKLTNGTDKHVCFSPLLQALKMCCIMLAKFHNLHEKNYPRNTPFTQELDVAASQIESCIKGLQSSHKEMHNCLLIRIDAYELKAVDILVFKSIRIIMFALHFLQLLISVKGSSSTGDCIMSAFEKTKTALSKFSKRVEFQMQISSPRMRLLNNTTKWPSLDDTRKIAEINFIISEGGRTSFSTKIYGELKKLVGMLKEEPVRGFNQN